MSGRAVMGPVASCLPSGTIGTAAGVRLIRSVTVRVMSEYQYYEFAAVDRPLDRQELADVCALSTRAHITPTSFVNEYHWGNFCGNPQRLVEQYYDAFLYLANWGTRQLMLRFPVALLAPSVAERYCVGESASSWSSSGYVIVSATSEDDESGFEWGGEGVLSSVLPVRAEILSGDLRALYLMWLLEVGSGVVDGREKEPPVPEGLATLTGSQTALAEFLRIDPDLLAVAASASATRRQAPGPDIEGWVANLAAAERDALLIGLLRGDEPHLRATTLRRMGTPATEERTERTAGQLVDAACARRDARERAEKQRREQATAENARLAAKSRRRQLDELAAEGERAWSRVATRIAEKKPVGYDIAVALLGDLQEVTADAEFDRRIAALKEEHRRKPAFLERLTAAGL